MNFGILTHRYIFTQLTFQQDETRNSDTSATRGRCTHTFMTLTFQDLAKDITNIDVEDILSCWQWKVADMKAICTISCLGDMFFIGQDDGVYWLQTDHGELSKVAEDFQQFKEFLTDEDKIDTWFLPSLVEELIIAGKILKENEVYSYTKLPVIGGEYCVDNIIPTDISVHFALTGQIFEQIRDLPDGTNVSIKVKK